jgi:hypothetical protein
LIDQNNFESIGCEKPVDNAIPGTYTASRKKRSGGKYKKKEASDAKAENDL